MKLLRFFLIVACISCNEAGTPEPATDAVDTVSFSSIPDTVAESDIPLYSPATQKIIETGTTTPTELLAYAISLTGTPYKYGSTNPLEGFDCSGFITYVFNHFKIAVPRSSVDFTNVEREVSLEQARPGDLILFTGTDSMVRVVGHMGIINAISAGEATFIHSSSGKNSGVVITPLNSYYMGRFMKVIRIFKQNDIQ